MIFNEGFVPLLDESACSAGLGRFGAIRFVLNRWRQRDRETECLLTRGLLLGYRAAMPIHFILPKKFTRAQIEWRVDELALQFQGTKDKKLLAQIAALNRLLARMDAREFDSSMPRNRQ
jgi:hypothetical protein